MRDYDTTAAARCARPLHRLLALAGALAIGLALPGAHAQDTAGCGSAEDSAAGPYDYRTVKARIREDVERNHFTPPVQMLVRGQSTRVAGGVGRDISYTLHLMPNHPQALLAMMRLGEKEKSPRPRGARYPVACYFERAIGFVPDDYNVRVLYGVYLARAGQAQEARRHLELAAEKAPDDANVQYNVGLAYFELKDFDKSLEHAKRAYELGFELPGLRRKLEAEGKWSG
jgi:tetratricopeptide (TPR) repeat protein